MLRGSRTTSPGKAKSHRRFLSRSIGTRGRRFKKVAQEPLEERRQVGCRADVVSILECPSGWSCTWNGWRRHNAKPPDPCSCRRTEDDTGTVSYLRGSRNGTVVESFSFGPSGGHCRCCRFCANAAVSSSRYGGSPHSNDKFIRKKFECPSAQSYLVA